MKLNILFIVLVSLNANLAFSAPCADAYISAVINGPLSDQELVSKLKCETEASLSKKNKKMAYVCVFSGTPKYKLREQYGTGDMLAILSEEASPARIVKKVVGEWYAYKGVSRDPKDPGGLEEIFVQNTDIGTKVLRKTTRDENTSLFNIEKITLSLPEKTLRYEKLLKTKSKSKLRESAVFRCGELNLQPSDESLGLDKDGLPLRGNPWARKTTTSPPGKKSTTSGISGVK